MNSADARDYSKEPPAILDPLWILAMRARLRSAVGAGWPGFAASRERGASSPDWGIAKIVDRM